MSYNRLVVIVALLSAAMVLAPGLAAGAATLGALIGGPLSDAIGRRKVLLLFFLLAGLLIGSCGFLPPTILIAWLIIPAYLCIGGVRPVINSVVADLTGRERRIQAFSLLYLGVNMGIAVGPMIAGFLFANYIEWIFWGDAITTFVAFTLVLLFVPETRPSGERGLLPGRAEQPGRPEQPGQEVHSQSGAGQYGQYDDLPLAERPEAGSVWQALRKRPVVLLFVPLAVGIQLVYGQHAFALPLQLSRMFGEIGAQRFGMIMSTNAIVVLAATTVVLRLFGHRRALSNIALGVGLYMVGFGLYALVKPFSLFLLLVGVWSVGEILVFTNASLFIANHTPANYRGRFNGLLMLAFGLGFTFAPYIGGHLVSIMGVRNFWFAVGGFAGVVAALFFLLSRIDARRFSAAQLEEAQA